MGTSVGGWLRRQIKGCGRSIWREYGGERRKSGQRQWQAARRTRSFPPCPGTTVLKRQQQTGTSGKKSWTASACCTSPTSNRRSSSLTRDTAQSWQVTPEGVQGLPHDGCRQHQGSAHAVAVMTKEVGATTQEAADEDEAEVAKEPSRRAEATHAYPTADGESTRKARRFAGHGITVMRDAPKFARMPGLTSASGAGPTSIGALSATRNRMVGSPTLEGYRRVRPARGRTRRRNRKEPRGVAPNRPVHVHSTSWPKRFPRRDRGYSQEVRPRSWRSSGSVLQKATAEVEAGRKALQARRAGKERQRQARKTKVALAWDILRGKEFDVLREENREWLEEQIGRTLVVHFGAEGKNCNRARELQRPGWRFPNRYVRLSTRSVCRDSLQRRRSPYPEVTRWRRSRYSSLSSCSRRAATSSSRTRRSLGCGISRSSCGFQSRQVSKSGFATTACWAAGAEGHEVSLQSQSPGGGEALHGQGRQVRQNRLSA